MRPSRLCSCLQWGELNATLTLVVMFVFASMVAVAAYAQVKPPATQVVDLKAGGGVTLKATYYPAARPGPGEKKIKELRKQ